MPFCKDELPTWEEIHTFLKQDKYIFTPEDTELDPYWNIPKQKIQLAFICNQLNKLIYDKDISTMYFYLSSGDVSPFVIYSAKIPSTGKFSIFMTDDTPREDIALLPDNLSLEISINNITQSFDIAKLYVNILFREVIEYYTEPIGWKSGN